MNENLTQAIALVKEWNAGDPAVLAIKIAQVLFEVRRDEREKNVKPSESDLDLLARINHGRDIVQDSEGGVWVRRESALDAIAEACREGAGEMRERAASLCDDEAHERRCRMDSRDQNWGDSMAQGHKSVTAGKLADAIRAIPVAPETEQIT